MGSVGDCYDNSLAESFFGTLQLELLDTRTWVTRQELANAIFEKLSPIPQKARHSCLFNPPSVPQH